MNIKNLQENNEELVKQYYDYWIKFKDELFKYLLEIIKVGKIKMFYCNNCQKRKDNGGFKYLGSFLWL